MFLQDYLKARGSQFQNICEFYRVRKVYAFGSSVNGNFSTEKSDVDLIIEIEENNPITRGNKLMELWNKLEEFFQRKVDMLTPNSINNPILKESIENSKVLVYER